MPPFTTTMYLLVVVNTYALVALEINFDQGYFANSNFTKNTKKPF
jgi:hypothetical protein